MRGTARRRRGVLGAIAAAVATASLVTASGPAGAQAGDAPGVSDKEIRVGAIIARTNPTGIEYQHVVDGAQAYFDIVNKQGGVNGRKIKIVKVIDDQSRTSKSAIAARSLIEESKVFAAFHASQVFAGADAFAEAGTPVFGYNIQEEWSLGPNFFGTYGSYLCLDACPQYPTAFVAQQEGAEKVAVFAYGSSPQSADCAEVSRDAFDRWGPEVAVFDTSLSFGFSANDISGAVQAIKENGVDYVTTCMDLQGLLNLKRAVDAAGIQGVRYYAPQGYDGAILEELGDELEDFFFLAQFTPFEAAKGNPGMQRFLKEMKKRGYTPNENYVVGWAGAALLVRGLEEAGESPTQQAVVEAINRITDWDADGVVQPVDWTTAHGPAAPGEIECIAYVTVEKGEFVPLYGEPGKPYVCMPVNPYPDTLDEYTTYGPAGA